MELAISELFISELFISELFISEIFISEMSISADQGRAESRIRKETATRGGSSDSELGAGIWASGTWGDGAEMQRRWSGDGGEMEGETEGRCSESAIRCVGYLARVQPRAVKRRARVCRHVCSWEVAEPHVCSWEVAEPLLRRGSHGRDAARRVGPRARALRGCIHVCPFAQQFDAAGGRESFDVVQRRPPLRDPGGDAGEMRGR